MLIKVDLPQPLGPNTETIRCLGMSRSKFSYNGAPAKYLVKPGIVIAVPGGPGTNGGGAGSGAISGCKTALMSASRTNSSSTPVHDAFLDHQEQHVEGIAKRAG